MPKVFIKKLTVSNDAIDMNNHVNNIVYLSWMQEAAIQHSEAQGWPIERYLKTGGSWVVRSHFIKYLHPAFLGDSISILTWVSGIRKQSSMRKYLFWRGRDKKVLAEAETNWVFVDLKTGRPCLIPPELRSAFEIVSEDNEELLQTAFSHENRQT